MLGFGGYIVWHVCYENYLRPETLMDEYVTHNLIVWTESILPMLGYEVKSNFQLFDPVFRHRVGIEGAAGVFVGTSCDGVVLFALFAIFVAAFPGRWTRKIWFIPLGITVLHGANIFRIISLLLIQVYAPSALDFNHDYTFTIFVYSIIFILWYWWAMGASGQPWERHRLKVEPA